MVLLTLNYVNFGIFIWQSKKKSVPLQTDLSAIRPCASPVGTQNHEVRLAAATRINPSVLAAERQRKYG